MADITIQKQIEKWYSLLIMSAELITFLEAHKTAQQKIEEQANGNHAVRNILGLAVCEHLAPKATPIQAAELMVASGFGYLPTSSMGALRVEDVLAEGFFDSLTFVSDKDGGQLAWAIGSPEIKNYRTYTGQTAEEILGTEYDAALPVNMPLPKPLYVPVKMLELV